MKCPACEGKGTIISYDDVIIDASNKPGDTIHLITAKTQKCVLCKGTGLCDRTKLNVGSGKDYREGWVNVDMHPKFNPDVLGDIQKISFEDESFDEILAQDVIDHVTFHDCRKLIRKFHRWLKPGGTLNIHTPNLEQIGILAARGDHEALKWLYGTDGEGSTNYETNIIRWCYSRRSLKDLLEPFKFKIVESKLDCIGYGIRFIAKKEA